MHTKDRPFFTGGILLLGILLSVPVFGASIVVDSTLDAVDTNPGDGLCMTAAAQCTLRAAIQETNQLPGADVITLPTGGYSLSIPGEGEDLGATGDLDILDDLTLQGSGADLTQINGAAMDRVIHSIGFGKTVVLADLHIVNGKTINGNDGGGVTFVLGNGTIRRCFIESNIAVPGGASNGDGGGVYISLSNVLIESSTIAFNAGSYGGGIASNGGNTIIENSTISGNLGNGPGGGISITGTAILRNTTVTENQGQNGGGIFVAATNSLSTVNSIIAGNTASMSNDCGGSITSSGFNLVQDASGCLGLIASDITGVTPLLGALSDQGGPTLTHPLLLGSPAINTGLNANCALMDQRGITRPQGEVCDIGAFEDVYQCLFCDFFTDGVLDPNWNYLKPGWTESNSHLVGASTHGKAFVLAQPAFSGCSVCGVEAILQTAGGTFNKLWLMAWYVDKKNHVEVLMSEAGDKFVMKQKLNGAIVARTKALMPIDPNVPYTVKAVYDGVNFTLRVNGNVVASMLAGGNPNGTVGFQVKNTTGSIDSIIIIAP